MNVKQLIEELKTYPQDYEVYTSVDAEGNWFKQFGGFCDAYIAPEKDGLPYHAESIDHQDEYEEDDPERPEHNVLIIWPA